MILSSKKVVLKDTIVKIICENKIAEVQKNWKYWISNMFCFLLVHARQTQVCRPAWGSLPDKLLRKWLVSIKEVSRKYGGRINEVLWKCQWSSKKCQGTVDKVLRKCLGSVKELSWFFHGSVEIYLKYWSVQELWRNCQGSAAKYLKKCQRKV